MDLKKGILYITFGYIFIFLNFYLNISGIKIDLLPNFVGWLLLFFAYNKLGHYVKDMKYLHYLPLIFIFWGIVCDILVIIMFGFYALIIEIVFGLVSIIYWINLFYVLLVIAEEKKSNQKISINTLKYLNITICIISIILSILNLFVPILYATYILFIIALVIVIITIIVLSKLKKEVGNECNNS